MPSSTRLRHVPVGLVVGLLLTSGSHSQEPPQQPEFTQEGLESLPPEIQLRILERFDGNADGRLDADELRAWRDDFEARPPRGGPPGGPGGPSKDLEIVEKFDANRNGRLEREERDEARAWLVDNRPAGRGPGGRSGRGRGRGGPGRRGPPGEPETPELRPAAERLTPPDVEPEASRDLYDLSVVRTLFLEFEHDDWSKELADFYRTDVEVPARLTVDGRVYEDVGLRYRGNSSYFTLGDSPKKSFHVSLDAVHRSQDLHGFRNLKLLNGHADPSFLRETVFARIQRDYIAAPRVNLVKLVINGESWGVYVNVETFDRDFLEEHFGTKKGVRWKIPAGGRGGGGGLTPATREELEARFELKTASAGDEAWERLGALCRILDETPDERLEAELAPIFDIDGALWYIALENVLMDGDSYLSRTSDYALYEDPDGRFHLIPHDGNESFGYGGGPGRSWPRSPTLDPFDAVDSHDHAVIRRLLGIPHLRSRYAAHVRTIVEDWISWSRAGALFETLHARIDEEVKKDAKRLYDYSAFAASLEIPEGGSEGRTPALRSWVEGREEFLRAHAEIFAPAPAFLTVGVDWNLANAQPRARVTASFETPRAQEEEGERARISTAAKVLLWWSPRRAEPYRSLELRDDGESGDSIAGDGVFSVQVPEIPAGEKVRYYLEARSETGSTRFWPSKAESSPLTLRQPR